jgi:hypothetical protein
MAFAHRRKMSVKWVLESVVEAAGEVEGSCGQSALVWIVGVFFLEILQESQLFS